MAQQAAPSTVATPVPDHDYMPLNGIHHVELYVGNALQAAYYYAHAFGFRARRLPRPGDRHARPGLPRPPAGPHPPRPHRRAALRLADRRPPAQARRRREGHRPERAERRPRLPRGHHAAAPRASPSPTSITDEHGTVRAGHRSGPTARRCTPSSSATATTGRSSPASSAVEDATEDSGMLLAIDHIVGNVELGAMDDVGQVLRGRLRDDRDDPLLRRRHLDRVLGAHVQGRQRRQGPREVPDQRARRGQAQVADRRVPRVLRGRRARSTSPSPRATSSAR